MDETTTDVRTETFDDLMRAALDDLQDERQTAQKAGVLEWSETAVDRLDDRRQIRRFVDDLTFLLWGGEKAVAVDSIVDMATARTGAGE